MSAAQPRPSSLRVGKSGQSRRPRKTEIAGSNPAAQTIILVSTPAGESWVEKRFAEIAGAVHAAFGVPSHMLGAQPPSMEEFLVDRTCHGGYRFGRRGPIGVLTR